MPKLIELHFISSGQRLAEQMQQQNPELVDQLRRQMGGGQGPQSEDNDGNAGGGSSS